MSLQSHQQEFIHFCKDLETLSSYAPAFACYPLVFPPSLRSNRAWDSLVAPTLVLQWVHQQQGGLPPKHLLGQTIMCLNQGGPYRRANNLCPRNLAAANATAIFALLNKRPEFCEAPNELGSLSPSMNLWHGKPAYSCRGVHTELHVRVHRSSGIVPYLPIQQKTAKLQLVGLLACFPITI
jgi:hypothetical protein